LTRLQSLHTDITLRGGAIRAQIVGQRWKPIDIYVLNPPDPHDKIADALARFMM